MSHPISPPTGEPSNAVLAAALEHASRDWRVFPVREGTKHPLIRLWQQRATTDEDQIRAWFSDSPQLNLGVATGHRSGLVVLDLDSPDARRALERLRGLLPDTYEVQTSRGSHLYYAVAERCANRTRLFGLKVDVRGDGGLVVAPPSVNAETGVVYQRIGNHDIVAAPAWLVDEVRRADDRPDTEIQSEYRSCPHGLRKWRIEDLLHDPLDWEQRDAVRHADPNAYRTRHRVLMTVILSELQRGCDEACVISTIEGSTLWAKARNASPGSPEAWLRERIAEAQRWISDRPAGWILPRDHQRLVERHAGGLSAGLRKVLAAIQEEVFKHGEGLYDNNVGWVTLSYAEIAIGAAVRKGSVGKMLETLQAGGWIRMKKSRPGRGMASRFALDIPSHLVMKVDEGGEGDDSANQRSGVGVEESSSSPQFRHRKSLNSLSPAIDALRHGALGSTYPTWAFLVEHRDEGFMSVGEVVRRMGRPRSTIRTHLKKLEQYQLITRDESQAVMLASEGRYEFPALAAELGVDGVGAKQIAELTEERLRRKQERKMYAQDHGIPRRQDPGEEESWGEQNWA